MYSTICPYASAVCIASMKPAIRGWRPLTCPTSPSKGPSPPLQRRETEPWDPPRWKRAPKAAPLYLSRRPCRPWRATPLCFLLLLRQLRKGNRLRMKTPPGEVRSPRRRMSLSHSMRGLRASSSWCAWSLCLLVPKASRAALWFRVAPGRAGPRESFRRPKGCARIRA